MPSEGKSTATLVYIRFTQDAGVIDNTREPPEKVRRAAQPLLLDSFYLLLERVPVETRKAETSRKQLLILIANPVLRVISFVATTCSENVARFVNIDKSSLAN